MRQLLKSIFKGLAYGSLFCVMVTAAAAMGNYWLSPAKEASTQLEFDAPFGTRMCRFKVKGMHCKTCERMVVKSIMEESGVAMARADFEQDIALVAVKTDRVDTKAIEKAVKEKTGYETSFIAWEDADQ